jgi:hypothetical protein
MPGDEIAPRTFPAFDKELDGISAQTMEDHYKLYEGYVRKTNECRRSLNEFDYSEIEGNQVYCQLRAASVDYTFALLGRRTTSCTSAISVATAASPRAASPSSSSRSSTAACTSGSRWYGRPRRSRADG